MPLGACSVSHERLSQSGRLAEGALALCGVGGGDGALATPVLLCRCCRDIERSLVVMHGHNATIPGCVRLPLGGCTPEREIAGVSAPQPWAVALLVAAGGSGKLRCIPQLAA